MATVFDTAATVRALEETGLEREPAKAIATACREAALAQLETKLTWRLVYVAGVVIAAVKLIPNPY